MGKVARSIAVGRLLGALLRFTAEWRGHPASYTSLYGLFGDPSEPYRLPSALYRIPIIPVRIWLRVGDALLFRLWYYTRVPLARVTAAAVPEYEDMVQARRVRDAVNRDLATRDALGLAPDGGSFDPGPRLDKVVGIRPRSDAAREDSATAEWAS